MIDDQSNRTGVDYDQAGRRVAIDNPDTGLVEYRFDPAGNLTEKITPNLRAQQESIRYSYNFNRLARIDYPDMAGVSYTYGDRDDRQYNRVGRIASVANGDLMEERFYGELGETVKTVKSIRSDSPARTWATYTTEYLFDYLGRMRQLTYPDGEVLTYTYDQGGLLASATGVKQKTTYPYLKELAYDEYGQRVRMQLGNGVATRYQYDARTRRLDHILSLGADGQVLQNIDYSYDKVGNITGTENAAFVTADNFVRNVKQTYEYDDLHRLVQADGSYAIGDKHLDNYRNTFGYDSIGNFRQKDQRHWFEDPTSGQQTERPHSSYAYAYAYRGAQPHAPSHVGDMSYDYDANGNLTMRTEDQSGRQRIIDWNEENRITRILDQGKETVFRYDDAGTRIVKSGKYGETVYVDANYSIRNGEVASKHIFAGSTRIATKLVMQENRSGGSKQASRPRTVATTTVTIGADIIGDETATDTADSTAATTTDTTADSLAVADTHGRKTDKSKTTTTGLPGRSEKGMENALANGNGHKYGLYKHLDRLGYTVTDDKQIVPKATDGDDGGMLDPVGHGNTRPEEQQIYYYHGDHLGSSNVVTDRFGRTYEHLEYFPYGETWVEESRNQTNLPYKFTSKELDPETGLYYFGARYYDPRVSVWVSTDPMLAKFLPVRNNGHVPGGGFYNSTNINLFNYSNLSPVTLKDPDGNITIAIEYNPFSPYGAFAFQLFEDGKIFRFYSKWVTRGVNEHGQQVAIRSGFFSYVVNFFENLGKNTPRLDGEMKGEHWNGGGIETLGPNKVQKNKNKADGIRIHQMRDKKKENDPNHGGQTYVGSEACNGPVGEDNWEKFYDGKESGDKGSYLLIRLTEPFERLGSYIKGVFNGKDN